jgi:dTDP-4-amino-4,6-dideoxy-D-galactose acyltransferase
MMQMNIERLHWDSDFFGINVARLSGQCSSLSELSVYIEQLRNAGIDLAYLMLAEPLSVDLIGGIPICLADEKLTYVRTINSGISEALEHRVIPCPSSIDGNALDRLAIQSGVYSRFCNDPRIPKGKFEDLYRSWIRKSLDGTLAKKVFVTAHGNQPTGMITVNATNEIGEIGLVAVNELERGQGYGHALMAGALNWFANQGLRSVQVVTQGANRAACHLYEAHGFRLLKKDYIYHLWL